MTIRSYYAPITIDFSFEELYLRTEKFQNHRSAKPAMVAVVPGASVYKNEPSAVLKDRLDCALELYHQGKVKKSFSLEITALFITTK